MAFGLWPFPINSPALGLLGHTKIFDPQLVYEPIFSDWNRKKQEGRNKPSIVDGDHELLFEGDGDDGSFGCALDDKKCEFV
jgi:hypothetical protein